MVGMYQGYRAEKLAQVSNCDLNNFVSELTCDSKHLDSHVKPHVCPEETCSHRAAKARDLKRHMLSHGILPGTEIYYCPSPGCDHSRDGANRPFARFDNAARHIKKKHPALNKKPLRRIHDQ